MRRLIFVPWLARGRRMVRMVMRRLLRNSVRLRVLWGMWWGVGGRGLGYVSSDLCK